MGPFNQDDVNDGSSSASSDNGVTMKPASAYDYSKDEIDGKFTADWNYIANGTGGWWGSRMWNTFSRDWSASSTSQKVEFFQNTIVGGSGEDPIGEFEYTNSAGKHFSDIIKYGENAGRLSRPYMKSPLTIQEIMSTGAGIPDATFPGGMNWRVPGAFNGSQGTWELGINPETNTIYHFNFTK